MSTKSVSIGRKIIGIFFGLIVFAISSKVLFIIIVAIGAAILGSDKNEALKNIEATANIIAFLLGAVLFNKTYKAFTGTVLFRVWGFSKRKDNTTDK